MPYTIVTIIHILACFFLVLVVLLQTGKGADVGAVFGGSSQTIFGSQGAGDFLTKTTTGIAVLFMITSLFLSYGASRQQTQSIFDAIEPAPAPAPAENQAAPATESSNSEAGQAADTNETSQAAQESGEGGPINEPQAAAPTANEAPETASPAADQAASAVETEPTPEAEPAAETTPDASAVSDPLSPAPVEPSGN